MTWSQRVAVTTRLIEGPEHEPRTASTLQPGKPVHPPNELSSFFLLLFFFFLFPFSSFPFGWYIVSPTAPSDPPTTPTTPLPTYLPVQTSLRPRRSAPAPRRRSRRFCQFLIFSAPSQEPHRPSRPPSRSTSNRARLYGYKDNAKYRGDFPPHAAGRRADGQTGRAGRLNNTLIHLESQVPHWIHYDP